MRASIAFAFSALPNFQARYAGIELERVPMDGEVEAFLSQRRERAFEVALTDVAPGADRVGDDVDASADGGLRVDVNHVVHVDVLVDG
jgi:hypothetical protein